MRGGLSVVLDDCYGWLLLVVGCWLLGATGGAVDLADLSLCARRGCWLLVC